MLQLICAKYVVPVDQPVIPNGAMVVEDGKILEIGSRESLQQRYAADQTEEFPEHALMPGLINAHVHLALGGHVNSPFDPVRNVMPEVSFIDWLLSSIDYKKRVTQEILHQVVEEGIDASLESGVTCLADMGSYDGSFKILAEKGIRAVVFPEIISYDKWLTQDLFETALALVEKYQDEKNPLVDCGLAPYAPYTLSRQILKILASYCEHQHVPLMTHVSESFSEMEFFYNSTGEIAYKLFPKVGWTQGLPPPFQKTPIAYLDEIGFLRCKPLLVGGSQWTPDDVERIARTNSRVVVTPRANNYLKLGQTKLDLLIEKNIPVALGTDSLASNANYSLWDEMRFLHKNLPQEGQLQLPAEVILKMATLEAARVLGLDKKVGSLTVGKEADYIVVSLGDDLEPADLYAHLIDNTKTFHVKKVAVAGKQVK